MSTRRVMILTTSARSAFCPAGTAGSLTLPCPRAGGGGVPQVWDGPMAFHLANEATDVRVFGGQTVLAAPADAPTDLDTNFAGTDVWQMDFSAFAESGRFHLMVEGVGRSQSFDISDNHWSAIFGTAFSGFYHARSGIALEAPWTEWTRERSLHPDDGIVTVYGAGSWLAPTPLYAYAPDIWSSWEYAAPAARLARLLEPHDPAGAAGRLDSAKRAMTWAEGERASWVADNGPLHLELSDARNLAALEMYIATGEARWHDLFKATSNYRTDRDLAHKEYQTAAAFHYAMLDPALTDPVIAARSRANLLDQMQWYLDNALNSGFGYSFNPMRRTRCCTAPPRRRMPRTSLSARTS
jgi:hypothetical protein